MLLSVFYEIPMRQRHRISSTRTSPEGWRLAADIAFRDPDVLVDPHEEARGDGGLVLHKPYEPGSIVLSNTAGVNAEGPGGSLIRSWPAVFSRPMSAVVAESIDVARWSHGPAAIGTSPAAAVYFAIAAAFALPGPPTDEIEIRNRWLVHDTSGYGHLSALDPFPTAVTVAADECKVALINGLALRPTRWWLLLSHGMPKVVFDDQEGVAHTHTRSAELPQGDGVDAREDIFKMMFALLVEGG